MHVYEPSDVRERIKTGAYTNPMPYPHGSIRSNRPGHLAFRAESEKRLQEFKQDALKATNLTMLSPERQEKVWEKAWSSHHAYGYLDVFEELVELADLFDECKS